MVELLRELKHTIISIIVLFLLLLNLFILISTPAILLFLLAKAIKVIVSLGGFY